MIPFRFPLGLLTRSLFLLAGLALMDALAADAQAGLGTYFSGLATRSRVVQVCVVTMAIALFIMMKKFAPQESDPSALRSNVNYAGSERSKDPSCRA
jgi:hypothetical protein